MRLSTADATIASAGPAGCCTVAGSPEVAKEARACRSFSRSFCCSGRGDSMGGALHVRFARTYRRIHDVSGEGAFEGTERLPTAAASDRTRPDATGPRKVHEEGSCKGNHYSMVACVFVALEARCGLFDAAQAGAAPLLGVLPVLPCISRALPVSAGPPRPRPPRSYRRPAGGTGPRLAARGSRGPPMSSLSARSAHLLHKVIVVIHPCRGCGCCLNNSYVCYGVWCVVCVMVAVREWKRSLEALQSTGRRALGSPPSRLPCSHKHHLHLAVYARRGSGQALRIWRAAGAEVVMDKAAHLGSPRCTPSP